MIDNSGNERHRRLVEQRCERRLEDLRQIAGHEDRLGLQLRVETFEQKRWSANVERAVTWQKAARLAVRAAVLYRPISQLMLDGALSNVSQTPNA